MYISNLGMISFPFAFGISVSPYISKSHQKRKHISMSMNINKIKFCYKCDFKKIYDEVWCKVLHMSYLSNGHDDDDGLGIIIYILKTWKKNLNQYSLASFTMIFKHEVLLSCIT